MGERLWWKSVITLFKKKKKKKLNIATHSETLIHLDLSDQFSLPW